MQRFRPPSPTSLLPSFRPICISYISAPFSPLILLAVLLNFLLPLPFLIRLGFFNGMSGVFEPETLNFSTLSRSIQWILSVSRIPISTRLAFYGFLDTLLCDLIVLTSGLAFFLLITRSLAVMSSL